MTDPISIENLLLEKKLITNAQLKKALDLSKKYSEKIEDVLLKNEMISSEKLYRVVAESFSSQYVDIKKFVCDKGLLEEENMFLYIKHNFLPWRKLGKVVFVAVVEMHDNLFLFLKSKYPEGFRIVYTNPRGILVNIQRRFSGVAMSLIKKELVTLHPMMSSKKTLSARQKIWLTLLSSLSLFLFVNYYIGTIQAVFIFANSIFFLNIIFKTIIFYKGKNYKVYSPNASISDADLPEYTIILPVYKEGKVLEKLFKSIRKLKYPKSKLDVIVAVEQFDRKTMSFLKNQNKDGLFRVVCVPDGAPKTKPKACSYALKFAKGEYVTIYDAEDRPESNQLLKAVKVFRESHKSVACLQAKLKCINFKESMISFLFSVEYMVWFGFFLKGLERLGAPIPLGGSSNHFRLDALKRVGGWDPYNVTEDADLGYRLYKCGYKVRMLDSLTREEAPEKLLSWTKQRSRWIKGHMQTYLVHIRDSYLFTKEGNAIGNISFHAFIIFPIICYFLQVIAIFIILTNREIISPSLIIFSGFNLVLWIIASITFAVLAVQENEIKGRTLLKTVFFPFYYLLHSISAIIALYELIFKTYHWSKTEHNFDQRRQKYRKTL